MTIEELNEFCGRKYHSIMADDEHAYATDGMILIGIPYGNTNYQQFEKDIMFNKNQAVSKFWKTKPDNLTYTALPPITFGFCKNCNNPEHTVECLECEGTGIIEWETEYNNYEANCKSCQGIRTIQCEVCKGTGFNVQTPITIGGVYFSPYYLLKIVNLPEIRIAVQGPNKAAWFKFDGGEGCLMPMRY